MEKRTKAEELNWALLPSSDRFYDLMKVIRWGAEDLFIFLEVGVEIFVRRKSVGNYSTLWI